MYTLFGFYAYDTSITNNITNMAASVYTDKMIDMYTINLSFVDSQIHFPAHVTKISNAVFVNINASLLMTIPPDSDGKLTIGALGLDIRPTDWLYGVTKLHITHPSEVKLNREKLVAYTVDPGNGWISFDMAPNLGEDNTWYYEIGITFNIKMELVYNRTV